MTILPREFLQLDNQLLHLLFQRSVVKSLMPRLLVSFIIKAPKLLNQCLIVLAHPKLLVYLQSNLFNLTSLSSE